MPSIASNGVNLTNWTDCSNVAPGGEPLSEHIGTGSTAWRRGTRRLASVGDLREPIPGANALRSPSTNRDLSRRFLLVRGSQFDYLRPGQTPDSCLGVKGSPVQIRPSRRFFERLYPELGTKTAMIVPN